jgi:DNA-binding protein HU-beta
MKALVIQGKCLTCGQKTSFIAGNFPKRQEVAVNRTELVEKIAGDTGLAVRQAEGAVKAFIDTVVDETKGGGKVSIFGFGTFTPTSRAARTGRNPQTGAPVKIAASKSVRFAPASAYKSSLNAKGGAKKAAAKKSAPAKKAAAKKSAPAKKATGTRKASKTAKK